RLPPRSCVPFFVRSPTWSELPFDQGRREGKTAGKRRCRVPVPYKDAGRSTAASPTRCAKDVQHRHEFHRSGFVQTQLRLPYFGVKLKCARDLSNCSRPAQLCHAIAVRRRVGAFSEDTATERVATINPK